ncbi:MAG: glutathione S-transferase family protein [Nevskia sp.]|nr:glutathione S-transferase family protein [Nevskia sp.]
MESPTRPVTIIGSYLSPYVRKVLAVLHLKGIPYRIDPIVPFLGDDRFSAISPLRRVPVLIDDAVTLADSTVICEYLDERYAQPAVLPQGAAARAQARWLEEYADTRMGEVFIWQLFNQVAIGPHVWGRKTDEEVVKKAVEVEIPQVLDYLEPQLPAEGFLFGQVSVADLAIAVFFRNAAFARYRVDAARWPRTAGFVGRVLDLPCLAQLRPCEDRMLRTPLPQQRAVLAEMGAPLTEESYGTDRPRPGLMKL